MLSFLKISCISFIILLLAGCGGGTGNRENNAPIANAGEDVITIGGKGVTLDGSASSDSDGSLVEYVWRENEKVLGKQKVLKDVKFTEGTHEVSLTVKDDLGSIATDKLIVKSMCTDATSIELIDDINGELNTKKDNSSSCYKINLTSNGDVERYAFFINFYEGTKASRYYNSRNGDVKYELRNEKAELIKNFLSVRTKEGIHNYESFEISDDGTYYLQLKRIYSENSQNSQIVLPAKYGFSIQPSLGNGLIQDEEGEMNDFKNMATPLKIDDLKNDINGSLNYTRQAKSSLKNSDQSDYYEIDFDKSGIFTFYMNFYEGTVPSRFYNSRAGDVKIELKSADDLMIKKFTTVRTNVNSHLYEQFEIPSAGKYYLKIYRNFSENYDNSPIILPAKYGFSIHLSVRNGLVQDEEGEINDFKSMATPLKLEDLSQEINGSLNYTRTAKSSMKNTDQSDYYEIDFSQSGTFLFNMKFYEGTLASKFYNSRSGDVKVELKSADDILVKKFTTIRTVANGSWSQAFEIPSIGKYYLKIYRKFTENYQPKSIVLPAKYGFTITQ